MTYTLETDSYNEKRYGKPWLAQINRSLTKDFDFLDWTGRPGYSGQFTFDADPGTLFAYGQKDHRKNRGGVDDYYIAMPDGRLNVVSDGLVGKLVAMDDLDARWRRYSESWIDYLMRTDIPHDKDRARIIARHAHLLGVPDPLMAAIADALIPQPEPEPVPEPVIDASGFYTS